MSPKVALSMSWQTQKTTANFQEGSAEGTSRIHLREDRIRTGWGRFHLRLHVSKYRDPRRNLRNRRMTSFIDHIATINLIWFSARSNMAGAVSWPCPNRARDYPEVPLFRKHIVHVCHCAANARCQLPFICGTFIRIYIGSVTHPLVALAFVTLRLNRTYELPLIIIINDIHG